MAASSADALTREVVRRRLVKQALDPDSKASGETIGHAYAARPKADPEGSPASSGDEREGELLGRGGMGEVRRGWQRTLRRSVAVKDPLPPDNAAACDALLREAHIAAHLEHPNVLPVHELVEEGGHPRLVMKLIEGMTWRESLSDPLQLTIPSGREDPLADQIRILIAVCRALAYVHTRGMVHLDVKPDNVLVGHFEDVYLLDWGLAAAWRDDVPEWIPHVRDFEQLVGTPAYMAPEQALTKPEDFGPATDVYQLGAILYEVATGSRIRPTALHQAILAAGLGTMPPLDRLPEELGMICKRALAFDPSERYPDASALAAALRAYLRHRDAERLVRAGQARLRALTKDELNASEAEAKASEAAFAFEQALEIWPESPSAERGRKELAELRVERALSHGHADLAATHLASLSQPPPGLSERVEQALEANRAEAAAVDALKQRYNYESGLDIRVGSVALIAPFWCAWNLGLGYLDRQLDGLPAWAPVVSSTASVVIFFVGYYAVSDRFAKTAFNRMALGLVGAGLASALVYWTSAAIADLSPRDVSALSVSLYVIFSAVVSAALSRETWWVPLLMTPMALAAARWPDYGFEWAGVTGMVGMLATALAWRRAGRRLRSRETDAPEAPAATEDATPPSP